MIQVELDKLRMGGYPMARLESCLFFNKNCTHERIVSVVRIVNSESGHLFP